VHLIFSAEEWVWTMKRLSSAEFGRVQLGFCPRSNLPVILLSIVANRLGVSAAVFAILTYVDKFLPLAPALMVLTMFFALRVCL